MPKHTSPARQSLPAQWRLWWCRNALLGALRCRRTHHALPVRWTGPGGQNRAFRKSLPVVPVWRPAWPRFPRASVRPRP